MYVKPEDKKRRIVIDSPYLNAEFTYDCETEILAVKYAECNKQEPPQPVTGPGKRSVMDVARGVTGIVKSELQINKVSPKDLAYRWAACKNCVQNDYGFCAAKQKNGKRCGCRICDMIRDGKQVCALPGAERKWEAVSGSCSGK